MKIISGNLAIRQELEVLGLEIQYILYIIGKENAPTTLSRHLSTSRARYKSVENRQIKQWLASPAREQSGKFGRAACNSTNEQVSLYSSRVTPCWDGVSSLTRAHELPSLAKESRALSSTNLSHTDMVSVSLYTSPASSSLQGLITAVITFTCLLLSWFNPVFLLSCLLDLRRKKQRGNDSIGLLCKVKNSPSATLQSVKTQKLEQARQCSPLVKNVARLQSRVCSKSLWTIWLQEIVCSSHLALFIYLAPLTVPASPLKALRLGIQTTSRSLPSIVKVRVIRPCFCYQSLDYSRQGALQGQE